MKTPSSDQPDSPRMDPADHRLSDAEVLRGLVAVLAAVCPNDDVARVDVLGALEQVKCAAAGAQARITAAFSDSQRAAQSRAGVSARDLGTGVGAQIGLARRESPFRGRQHLGLALALRELPHTMAALSAGQVSEWRATVVARETGCLSRADRGQVDAELAARPGGLAGLGDRGVEVESRRIAYRLDPYAFTRRTAQAEAERRVSIRPAPDTMALVTGLLPVTQGVAVHAALTRHADTLRSTGDPRSRNQIMADTLVERVTGQSTAAGVPIEVHVVITDQALLAADHTPADLAGYGPIPAPHARTWLALPDASIGLRRLFTDPTGQDLVAMESTRRTFTGGLRRFIGLRDRSCRTPWCDAPIRHIDHANRAADGGPTTATNSQGLCEACNHAKEAPGWHTHASATAAGTRTTAGTGQTVDTSTPTGHHYASRPPSAITAPNTVSRPVGRPPQDSRMEAYVDTLLLLTG